MLDEYSTPATIALAALWALLIAASVIVWRHNCQKPNRELVQRTQSWWVMIALFSGALVAGKGLMVTLFGVISFLALKEFFSLIATRRADRHVLLWAYLTIPIQYFWIYTGWYGMFVIFIPVYMFLGIHVRMLLTGHTEGFIRSASTIQWGMMVCIYTVSHAAYLLVMPEASGDMQMGASLLLYLVFLTQFNDVAQYVWGKCFGKHKVSPNISPNKTWQGLLGGVATTTLLAWLLAPYLTQFSAFDAILGGLLIGFGGFFGDITLSAVKRDIGVKDMGKTIPGHGRILDRIDSLTFTAPLFLHFIRYFYY